MGLQIPTYPIYNGAATVACYANIRDINQNKVEGKYTLEGLAHFTTSDLNVEVLYLSLKSDEVFLNDWANLYTELKRELTARDIAFTDV